MQLYCSNNFTRTRNFSWIPPDSHQLAHAYREHSTGIIGNVLENMNVWPDDTLMVFSQTCCPMMADTVIRSNGNQKLCKMFHTTICLSCQWLRNTLLMTTAFWTLPVNLYLKKHAVSETGHQPLLRWKCAGIATGLHHTDRAILNRWTKYYVFFEYETMYKIQEPMNPTCRADSFYVMEIQFSYLIFSALVPYLADVL
jgi:hypothetical protein